MQRFNKSRKHHVVRDWICTSKSVFFCLVETRVQEEQISRIFENTFASWKLITNYDHHRLGRILVVWSNEVEVLPLYKSSQVITCWVTMASGKQFLCASIYASNF